MTTNIEVIYQLGRLECAASDLAQAAERAVKEARDIRNVLMSIPDDELTA